MEVLEGAQAIISELLLSGWRVNMQSSKGIILNPLEGDYQVWYRKGNWDQYEKDPGWWVEVRYPPTSHKEMWKSGFHRTDPAAPLEEFLVWWKDSQTKHE